MALSLIQKKCIVEEIAELANKSVSVVVADYTGLNAVQVMSLRFTARNRDVKVKIVCNVLARRSFIGTRYECLNKALSGQVLLLFANNELNSAARVVCDFAKENRQLVAKALSLGEGLVTIGNLRQIAQLPIHSEAIAQLLSVMVAPIIKLVCTIAEPSKKLIRVLMLICDRK